MPKNAAENTERSPQDPPNVVAALIALFLRPSIFFDRYVNTLPLSICWLATLIVGTQVFYEIRGTNNPVISSLVRSLPLGRAIWLDWVVFLSVGGVLGVPVLFLFS